MVIDNSIQCIIIYFHKRLLKGRDTMRDRIGTNGEYLIMTRLNMRQTGTRTDKRSSAKPQSQDPNSSTSLCGIDVVFPQAH